MKRFLRLVGGLGLLAIFLTACGGGGDGGGGESSPSGPTPPAGFTVYGTGLYEVWATNSTTKYFQPSGWIDYDKYYSVDQTGIYAKIGEASTTQSYPSGYRSYVVVTKTNCQIDAIGLPIGRFLQMSDFGDSGNNTLYSAGNCVDNIYDTETTTNGHYKIWGAPDGQAVNLGFAIGSGMTTGGTYQGFVVVFDGLCISTP